MTLKFFSTQKDTLAKDQSVLEIPFAAIELTDKELGLVDGGNGFDNNNDWDDDDHHHHHHHHHHGHHHHHHD
jgi:hypothetical protein